jgi:DNA (cytosine-5)-methyltransferase 1
MARKFVVLDLFSGAGGLTEGFVRQSFDFAAHIEKDPNAVNTLQTRLLYHNLQDLNENELYNQYYEGKIPRDEFVKKSSQISDERPLIIGEEISFESENSIIDQIKTELHSKFHKRKVDVIIGGPPCQAYSLVGRGKDENGMQNDPRNYLYKYYLRFLEVFQPELFVFENVPGIISAKKGEIYGNVINGCSDLGYHLDKEPQILNASDFGVIQNRKRVIFIGWKKEHELEYPEFTKSKAKENIYGILKDLPEIQTSKGTDEIQPYSKVEPSEYLVSTKIRNGNRGIRHHAARFHNEADRKIYRIALKKWNDTRQRLHYNELPEELKTHQNREVFQDRFKVVDGESYSHAILAHLAKDGHYFIHPDIKQARSLTVREAARIQSFPDDYLFEGPRSAKYVQIGNAVPPLMAEGIAGKIKEMLESL